MAKQEEGKTFWVWGQLAEEQHTALLEMSTAMGKHPRAIVELAVEHFIVTWTAEREAKGKDVPPTVKLESILIKDRANQLRLNQLKSMAYNHVQSPTDESAEQLATACDLAGISVEAILEQVSANPHVGELMSEGKSLTAVEAFLANHIKPGRTYLANDVVAAGELLGFRPYLIKEAKRKLGISSKRDKANWLWFFPDKQTSKEEEEVF